MDLTSNNSHTIDTGTKTPPPTQPTKTNTPKSLSFTTVTLKRPPHLHPTTAAAAASTTMVAVSFKECLKNHAASIGGHALDGCGEFMASSSTNPTDPRSLKCAACGCHRNFHRRDPPEPSSSTTTTTTTTTNNNKNHNNNPTFLNCFYSPPPAPSAAATTAPPPPPPQPLPHRAMSQSTSPSLSSSPSHSPSPMSSPSSPPPLSHVPPSYLHHHHHHHSSAPHMLLALGNAYSAVALPSSDHEHHQHIRNGYLNNNNSSMVVKGLENPMSGGNKKRYRTKFSKEQKEKMYSFSERLGWRMQKGDDGLVQEFCNDIGVPRGVFKVWMHNNKNSFKKRSSGLVGNAPNQNNIIHEKINNNGDDDDDDDNDDGNDGNNRVGGGGVAAGGFDSDINNPYNNTNGSNNSDIHRSEDGCVNVHVPINGLSS